MYTNVTKFMATWLLQEHIHLIVPFITNIVNKSILEEKDLACLKEAILIHLLKKSGLDLLVAYIYYK